MIPIVDESSLRHAVTPARAVEAMRGAFAADGEGRTHVPPVINLDIPGARGEFHIKTAHIAGVPHIAVKVASGFYDNPGKGLPSGSGLMAVFDAATGLPAALLLDNGFLTDIRTGAAGAVAADHLARQRITTVGVIGSGIQARFQVHCLRVVRDFSRIVAWSPTRQRLDAYCEEMRREGYDAQPFASAREVCAVADVLITATPSRRRSSRCDVAPSGHARDRARIGFPGQAGAGSRLPACAPTSSSAIACRSAERSESSVTPRAPPSTPSLERSSPAASPDARRRSN